jgi:hypothetical protein
LKNPNSAFTLRIIFGHHPERLVGWFDRHMGGRTTDHDPAQTFQPVRSNSKSRRVQCLQAQDIAKTVNLAANEGRIANASGLSAYSKQHHAMARHRSRKL